MRLPGADTLQTKRRGGFWGLSDSKSEQVQVSRMFRSWMKEDFAEKGEKKGAMED